VNEKKRLEVTLVVVLRLIMMVIVDGSHAQTHIRTQRERGREKKNYCNIFVFEMNGKRADGMNE
jgi:hypothetical protein